MSISQKNNKHRIYDSIFNHHLSIAGQASVVFQGTEDEGGEVPEVVVHRGDPGVVRVPGQTGRGLPQGGVDTEMVSRLPSLPIQLGIVLPHIAR